MSSILNSQGVVLATTMIVSSTALFLAFSRKFSWNHNSHHQPPQQTLRSCLYSGGKKRERKKKRVQFAENVKDTRANGEEYRKEHNKKTERRTRKSTDVDRICRNEMPANRIALYNGILRDRVHRIECSY